MEPEPKQFDLEKEYAKLEKKYNLPDFETLSQDFDMEKVAEKEPIFLAREIRRSMNEKITAYIQLFETLTNPGGSPMFVFKIIKNISEKQKKQIQEFYKILSKMQIEIMKRDTIYSEKGEVDFINNTFKIWQKMKLEIHSLFKSFETNFENDETAKGRSYFN